MVVIRSIKYIGIYITLTLYICLQYFLSTYIPKIFLLIINPLFFIGCSIYLFIKTNNNHGRFVKNKEYIKTMIIVMLLYFFFYVFLGLVLGFTRSPYSHSFISLLKNFWQVVVPIIGIEYIRSAIVNHNNKNKLSIILISLIIFLIELNISNLFSNIVDREEAFKYISSTVLPLIGLSVLYTYLSLKGSYKLVLSQRLMYEAIIFLMPIYPNMDWFVTGTIGLLFPTFVYILFKYYYDKKRRDVKRLNIKKWHPISYVFVLSLLSVFVCFMIGVFKYEPIAIASNSMVPCFYRGDVVVLRKADKNVLRKIKKYDIIVYRISKQYVVHRIIDKFEIDGEILYRTKGDNNNSPDFDLVREEQIVGVYQFSIKYVGHPSIWLSDYFNHEKPVVETK